MLYFIVWYLVGMGGFYYWWTTEYKLDTKSTFLMFYAALVGPLTFIIGWYIHGREKKRM